MKNVALNNLPNWFEKLSNQEKEKLSNDPFYYSMVINNFSYDDLLKSGWINHAYTNEQMQIKYSLLMSQLEYYYNKNNKKDLFLLINTGSYAPAHYGHIAMLKQAQLLVKEKGISNNPIMMFSPSHDSYVLNKSDDIKEWNIDKRIEKLNETINSYPYKNNEDIFIIDLWESIVCDVPVNFTDIIKKLSIDLNKLNIPFKIGYVFGSDNEDFANVFKYLDPELKDKYYGICIIREDYDVKKNQLIYDNVFYTNNIKEFSFFKSRDIRKKEFVINKEKNGIYAIREDNDIALKEWIKKYPQKSNQLKKSYKFFHDQLSNLINTYTGMPTKSILLKDQRLYVESLIKQNKKIINLDIGTNNIEDQYALNLGRLFILNDLQYSPVEMILRPELNNCVKEIPSGVYTFVDDDIASGKTFSLVQDLLAKDNIYFNKKINLAQEYCESKKIEYHLYDIIDTKDFLIGAFSGGLLCNFNNKNIRVPYIYPFVNLKNRAKIPYDNIKEFNDKVLKLNKKFYTKNSFLKIDDINSNLLLVLEEKLEKNNPIEIINKLINKLK